MRLGSRELTVYADIRNVFNFTNLVAIFAETGDVVNQLYANKNINAETVRLANEAGTLVRTRALTGGGTETGVDLSDCSAYQPASSTGIPNCIMLQRAEARFGNGDGFFNTTEQRAAYQAWWDVQQGPYTLYGTGRNIRLGFEFNF
jgi:hypothetical protein